MHISGSLVRNGIIAVLAFGLALPVLAQGGFAGPGWYRITNEKTGLLLTARDDRSVVQMPPRGGQEQVWLFEPAQNAFYFVRNGRTGFALEPTAGENSAPVLAAPLHGGPSQQWRLESTGNGGALIVNYYGRALDIPEGSRRPGLPVQIYDRNGDNNQRFLLTPVRGDFGGQWRGSEARPQSGVPGRGRGRGGDILRCSSENGRRTYCEADTRGGALLVRQLSDRPCRLNETWGFDARGIWVDRGCRGEFQINRR